MRVHDAVYLLCATCKKHGWSCNIGPMDVSDWIDFTAILYYGLG